MVAAKPGQRILNSADPDAPSGLEIARTIARRLDHAGRRCCSTTMPTRRSAGIPGTRAPIVLDMTAATELGYMPVGDYATTVAEEVEWLVEVAGSGDVAEIVPGFDQAYFTPMLDYVAEDRYLAAASSR